MRAGIWICEVARELEEDIPPPGDLDAALSVARARLLATKVAALLCACPPPTPSAARLIPPPLLLHSRGSNGWIKIQCWVPQAMARNGLIMQRVSACRLVPHVRAESNGLT